MNNGAVMNYDFGPKRHWRRWVWNRIAERLASAPRDSIALYLPGATDFDRAIAMDRGFRHENLIGVERDKTTVKALRTDGTLTIHGNFELVAQYFACRHDLDICFADMCSGLHPQLPTYIGTSWLISPHLRQCVFALNLMRGRDAASNTIRSSWQSCVEVEANKHNVSVKHRGIFIWLQAMLQVMSGFLQLGMVEQGTDAGAKWLAERINVLADRSNAVFSSYQSESGQTFDSVVFQNPFAHSDSALCTEEQYAKLTRKFPKIDKAKVAPILAHRTMRMT